MARRLIDGVNDLENGHPGRVNRLADAVDPAHLAGFQGLSESGLDQAESFEEGRDLPLSFTHPAGDEFSDHSMIRRMPPPAIPPLAGKDRVEVRDGRGGLGGYPVACLLDFEPAALERLVEVGKRLGHWPGDRLENLFLASATARSWSIACRRTGKRASTCSLRFREPLVSSFIS